MFELCDIENGCVMAGYDDAPIWNRSYIYTRTRRVIGVKEEKNRIKELIFWSIIINLSLLLEDSDLLNSDVDMADKISIRYSPECFSSFHYMTVSLMVLVLFEVAFPAFYILRDDSLI